MSYETGAESTKLGTVRVPEDVQARIESRIRKYAEEHYSEHYIKLDVRFRDPCCYIDVYLEPEDIGPGWPKPDWPESRAERLERLSAKPTHLCRLWYYGNEERWGFDFYDAASERYEAALFPDGENLGSVEDAFRVSAEAHLTRQ